MASILWRVVVTSVVSLIAFAWPHPANAQYQVYQWSNHEDAKFAAKYSPIGTSFNENVKLVDLSSLTGMPASFRSPQAASETGRYALAITTNPKASIVTGLATGVVLQRNKLGAHGKALYQADFFFPEDYNKMTNFAVLAMMPMTPGQKEPTAFYRFGMSKQKLLYFSFIEAGADQPTQMKVDKPLFDAIPKDGWHRLAIVFEGPETIHCFIDGQEAAFSPVKDSKMKELQVGIMTAEKGAVVTTYVDNLSIQWTSEDAPLPDSPYASTWQKTGDPGDPAAAPASSWVGGTWLDTATGREKSISTKLPMFVYFSAPKLPASQELDKVLTSDLAAQSYLKKYVPVKIDANQLQGGTIARSLNVIRIPTVLILMPDGKELGRATFSKGQSWQAFSTELTKAK